MRGKQKILSLFLAICMILSVVGPVRIVKAAVSGIKLTTSVTEVKQGGTVTVTITFPAITGELNEKEANNGTITVNYDSTKFDYVSSTNTSLATKKGETKGSVSPSISESSGKIELGFFGLAEGTVYDLSAGYNISFTFKAKNEATTGDSVFNSGSLEFMKGGVSLYDTPLGGDIAKTVKITENNNPVQTISATSEKLTLTYGDTNGKITGYTNAQGATISYAVVSGSDVISVNETTGAITTLKRGVATIRITGSETSSYKSAYKDISVTVNPRTVTINPVVTPATVKYTGTGVTPDVKVTTAGTPSFTLKQGTDYTVTYTNNVNIGTATATIHPVSSSNFTFNAQSTAFIITNKEVPELAANSYTTTYTGSYVSIDSIQKTATYNGVNVAGTWSWKNNVRPINAGTDTYVLVFTPNSTLYASNEISVTIKINKATISGTPSITDIYASGKTLRYDVNIVAPSTWPAGTFKWVDSYGYELNNTELTTPIVKNRTYYWIYNITNATLRDNYNEIKGSAIIWQKDTPDPIVNINGDSKNPIKVEIDNSNAKVGELTKNIVDTATASGKSEISIDLSGQTKVTAITLTKTSVETVSTALNSTANKAQTLSIKLYNSAVTFDKDAIKTIADSAVGDSVSVSVTETKQTDLASAQQLAINNFLANTTTSAGKTAYVFALSASVISGGRTISNFGTGKETVSMRYNLKSGQTGEHLHVYYVSQDGKLTPQDTTFKDGMVSFVTKHNSDYVVIYDESSVNNNTLTVRRLFNKKNGEHLLTTDDNEVKELLGKGYWSEDEPMGEASYEGIAVYRLFNYKSGEHLYTSDTYECQVLTTQKSWRYDNDAKPIFYGFESGTPVYRLFNIKYAKRPTALHINSSNPVEILDLRSKGYTFDNDGKPVFYLH